MNMTIRLEGTAAEIGDVLEALSQKGVLSATALELSSVATPAATEPEAEDTEKAFASTRFAKRVLQRLPLSPAQESLFTKLHGAHPDLVSARELQSATGYTPHQLAGLLGAIGRRVANTSGYDDKKDFFIWSWNEGKDAWDYGLPDSVCRALEESFPRKFPPPADERVLTK
ncbi:MAG: hypothetical protein OXH79_18680 [Boseongicola sp.]|nr:hypothetical protein [Boseongicola sp.]